MGKFYVGIEGGATHSTIVVLDSNGEIRNELHNQPPTNHWIAGMEKCCSQIASIVENALKVGGITEEDSFCALGLCLSGCEDDKSNEEMRLLMMKKLPRVEKVLVGSDTLAALFAVSDSGGIVLIAGTGSNCLLVNPDKTSARCGGWSYMLGDEGSAWWMAHKAIKLCVDELDNYEKAPHNIDYAWEAVKQHFNIKDSFGMLEHSYKCFNKPFYAELTMRLAEGADQGDEFCKYIFHSAGVTLAKHLIAVSPKIDPEMYLRPGGLPIVCIGSVWKSWKHLEGGFTSTIELLKNGQPNIKRFSLLKLKVSSAFGSALLAAPEIPRNYSNNAQVFYSNASPQFNGTAE